jgi:hypothetical protein
VLELWLGGRCHFCRSLWDGSAIEGNLLALVPATEPSRDGSAPRLMALAISSGAENLVMHPDALGRFLLCHRERTLVVYDSAAAFLVIHRHLLGRGEAEAAAVLPELIDARRLHDVGLLDALVRLAESDDEPTRRDLPAVVRQYAGLALAGADSRTVGPGVSGVGPLRERAAREAIALRLAIGPLHRRACALARDAGVDDSVIAQYGVLSEAVQVAGAVAMADVMNLGMRLDQAGLRRARGEHRRCADAAALRLGAHPGDEDVPRRDGWGGLARTATGRPGLRPTVLVDRLRELSGSIPGPAGDLSTTNTGRVSTSTKLWKRHGSSSVFVNDWVAFERACNPVQFLAQLGDGGRVHPACEPLVRTGRTSCHGPNIQAAPREGGIRELFVASPGHLLLIADYKAIELRALAAVCESRLGRSAMTDVLRRGIDPHSYAAAMLLGMPLAEFESLRGEDADRYADLRRKAKAINFGIPGGLGAAALVDYSRDVYGVELTVPEAKDFRRRLTEEVYPELALYLAEDAMALLAGNLSISAEDCWQAFEERGTRPASLAGAVRKVARGQPYRADGNPYDEAFCRRIWDGLGRLAGPAGRLSGLLTGRRGSPELEARLFGARVATLTGRVRGGVGYTQARNTPFQGLAADGAKLALWRLVREGYRVVGFVHDEVLVELPDEGGWGLVARRRTRGVGPVRGDGDGARRSDPRGGRLGTLDVLVEARPADRPRRAGLPLVAREVIPSRPVAARRLRGGVLRRTRSAVVPRVEAGHPERVPTLSRAIPAPRSPPDRRASTRAEAPPEQPLPGLRRRRDGPEGPPCRGLPPSPAGASRRTHLLVLRARSRLALARNPECVAQSVDAPVALPERAGLPGWGPVRAAIRGPRGRSLSARMEPGGIAGWT